jgi:hypothetical protein
MSVYVIEIAGRGIAAINADSLDDVETWFEGGVRRRLASAGR